MHGGKVMPTNGAESPRDLTAKRAYLALLCALPVFILFSVLGKWQQGVGAWICTTIVFLVIGVRWDLRKNGWFWIVMGFGLLLQTPFVLLVPWNNRNVIWITLLPVGVLDYFLLCTCVKLGEKLAK